MKLACVVKVYVALLEFLHVVSKGVMDFFLFLVLVSYDFVCAMGVKTSLTLGREEKSWGEGVSWDPT